MFRSRPVDFGFVIDSCEKLLQYLNYTCNVSDNFIEKMFVT